MEKEVSFADSESSSEKEAPRDFIISRAHSFKVSPRACRAVSGTDKIASQYQRDEHPAHPFVG
eukprot:1744072-Rhodomonas_salina.6